MVDIVDVATLDQADNLGPVLIAHKHSLGDLLGQLARDTHLIWANVCTGCDD